MSKQFRFYLLPGDVHSIISELKANIGVRLLDQVSDSSQPREIEDPIRSGIRPLGSNVKSVFCYLAPTIGEIKMAYYPKREKWLIQDESEVIEFSGCDYDGKALVIGRFYFQTDMLIGNSIWRKKSEFLTWGDQVFRFVKKRLTYSPKMMAYVGSAAAKWRREGGRFASGIYPNGVGLVYETDEE
jgi:hypothetical protein